MRIPQETKKRIEKTVKWAEQIMPPGNGRYFPPISQFDWQLVKITEYDATSKKHSWIAMGPASDGTLVEQSTWGTGSKTASTGFVYGFNKQAIALGTIYWIFPNYSYDWYWMMPPMREYYSTLPSALGASDASKTGVTLQAIDGLGDPPSTVTVYNPLNGSNAGGYQGASGCPFYATWDMKNAKYLINDMPCL
jgi:hypothetical protein